MDVLSDLLATLHLESEIRCRADLAAPWGVAIAESADLAPFYVVARGSCYLTVRGDDRHLPLVGGDVVMLPHGSAHWLRDSPNSSVVPLQEVMEKHPTEGIHTTVEHGGEGSPTTIIAGYFRTGSRTRHPLLLAMPPVIHVRGSEHPLPWLEPTLRFICSETAHTGPGSQVTVARLSDVLFIQLIRASMEEHAVHGQECNGNILRALADPPIAAALNAIHSQPDHNWTVAELAARSNMSRTAFSVRFTKMAGMPPLAYATRWRMLKAADLLNQHETTLATIAERVGYESEAAFSKAFKREMGAPPGNYRRTLRNA